jgi:tetratricopeptide (TPR) repeat protein
VGAILHNLGRALASLGHPLMARDHLERALTIDRNAYGEAHPDVLRDYLSLAALMRQLNDVGAAEEYEGRAEEVRRGLADRVGEESALATIES